MSEPVASGSAAATGYHGTRRTRVRVRYAETDRMGVVYYANYFVWFEVGRTEWLRDTGWSYREMEREGMSLPVSRRTASTASRPGMMTISRSAPGLPC